MKAKLCLRLVTIILLVSVAFYARPAMSERTERQITLVGQENQVYDIEASEWVFSFTAMGFGTGANVGRIKEFSVNGHDVLSMITSPRTLPVYQIEGDINHADLNAWIDLKKRSSSFAKIDVPSADQARFEALNGKVRQVGRRRTDIKPTQVAITVNSLPFKPQTETTYDIRVVVQADNCVATWVGSILVVDIGIVQTNPVWVPSQLHIHSSYSDGTNSPAQLATLLANKGYVVGYVTDETASWDSTSSIAPATAAGYTWSAYQTGVRTYTANIAMFPGAEVAASTLNQQTGDHNGHALAYGIGNFTGSGTFETTGLRYRWHLPTALLTNINNNQSGAHSSIAHPTHAIYPWNVWGSALGSVRYHGMELMGGIQTSFDPNASPMIKWRSELTHHLSGVFSGLAFPSARTGSDYCGNWYSPGLNFYTFIGLDSPPPWADLRSLTQTEVDTPLRKGRTVASRLGGMAAFTIKDSSGNDKQIGDYYTLTANTEISSTITVKPTVTGQYRVRVVENDFSRTVYDQTHSLTGGVASQFTFTFRFDGNLTRGNYYYHLVVAGVTGSSEYIYTSPIFIDSI